MNDPRTSAAARSLERLGTLVRDATPAPSLQQHLEGRARLIAAVEKMPRPARSTRPSLARPVAVFVFAAAAAAGVVSFVRSRPTPIAWHVENAPVGAQGYVSI